MAKRYFLTAGVIAIALSGCSLNDLIKPNPVETAPAAGQAGKGATGSSVSKEKVTRKAAAAVGADVVASKGQYLLCNLVDRYKERTTTYYLCREKACAGEESPVKGAGPKTKSQCLSACRKLEKTSGGKDANKSYCVS